MATEKTNQPLFTVENANRGYYGYSNFKTYEEAEKSARSKSWNEGEDMYVMAPVSVIRAPLEINTTTVEKL